ncbi:MAG: N-6 DNA methylase, partial [Patescibacteria group bacterium]
MATLFKDKKLKEILKDYQIPNFEEKINIIKLWYKAYVDGILKQKTESQCEQAFNQDFFGKILGYVSFPNELYTIEPKASTETSGQKPDAILGYFSKDKHKIVAVVEIKDVNKPLDKSQQREGNLTPIQQAFKYQTQYKNCEFVIATNFYETRLLKDDQLDYESFTLDGLLDEKDNYFQFKKFYYLLNSENFVSDGNKTKIEELVLEIRVEQELITKNFYNLYKDLRLNLMRDIWSHNKDRQNIDFTIKKAQKIVDRVVFICFCEDKNLLPENTLERVLKQSENNLMSLWDSLKGLFNLIDTGSNKLEIPEGYNGGLFAEDSDLDSLKISDKALIELLKLGHYDFEYDLSVNILGHIFEQSISDLEEIKNKVEKTEENKKESKRKKDGIFYTPDYIVNYIVKNSLMKYLGEKENSLKEKYNLHEDIQDKTYKERERKVYEEYQLFLQNIKVLDPACGSGAFLVRVFDYLLEENKRVGKILGDSLFNSEIYFRTILRNNIFGVDLNEESIEITKLSLWLKTAQKGKKLTTLDNNIKCGNSLIDDKNVVGEKAFNWEREFKDVFDVGGFDIVVGNPPYVRADIDDKNYQNQRRWIESCGKYETVYEKWDLMVAFFEKGLKLLKNNGYFSFISSNSITTSKYAYKLQDWILSNFEIKSLDYYENIEVFKNVGV